MDWSWEVTRIEMEKGKLMTSVEKHMEEIKALKDGGQVELGRHYAVCLDEEKDGLTYLLQERLWPSGLFDEWETLDETRDPKKIPSLIGKHMDSRIRGVRRELSMSE